MMKTTKIAKCGKYTLSHCNTKFKECEDCHNCILVKHNIEPRYKYVNGYKLKKCPHCGEYKLLTEFKKNSQGNRSWCYECQKQYQRTYQRNETKSFIVNYKVDNKKEFIEFDSLSKTIKFVRQHLSDNMNSYIEIKRIK